MVKLTKIAEAASGEIVGNARINIRKVSSIEEAGAGDLVFVLEEKSLSPAILSKAAAVVSHLPVTEKTCVRVKNARLAMARILPLFSPQTGHKPGISKLAFVSKNAKIGKRVSIYPFAYVGDDCEIGDDTIIFPSATIYDRVKIGKRAIIHSGAKIGFDGYGFVWDEKKYVKIPQLGTVTIEDDVEIFANVTIARATIDATRIGAGTKIDALTHIAHNCKVGKNCALTSMVGMAGSVTLKDHVAVGGMAGFNGHITVGENTVIMAKSGVTKDIPPNSIVSGFPAQNHGSELKFQAALKRLAKKPR